MRTSVAIVRGQDANPFELQTYAAMAGERWDMVAVAARRNLYDLSDLAMPVRTLPTFATGRIGRRLLGDRATRLRGLRDALKGQDIVHAAETFISTSEQAAELRESDRFRLVLTCWENIPFLHDADPAISRRKAFVRSGTDLFVAVTRKAAEALETEGVEPDRIVVQPVGVSRTVFRPVDDGPAMRTRLGIEQGANVILYCGRLVAEKGLVDLLLAVADLPDVTLVLVGNGPERHRLDVAIQALKLERRVVFPGRLPYSTIPSLYAAADVFCLPSLAAPYWGEQFGMVLAEAMACGVPIVTTRSGSIEEVVGDAAELVLPGAPEELRLALKRLLDSPERRSAMAEHGQTRVSERFDAQRVAVAMASIYERVLGQG